jgi:hypothetical protein
MCGIEPSKLNIILNDQRYLVVLRVLTHGVALPCPEEVHLASCAAVSVEEAGREQAD